MFHCFFPPQKKLCLSQLLKSGVLFPCISENIYSWWDTINTINPLSLRTVTILTYFKLFICFRFPLPYQFLFKIYFVYVSSRTEVRHQATEMFGPRKTAVCVGWWQHQKQSWKHLWFVNAFSQRQTKWDLIKTVFWKFRSKCKSAMLFTNVIPFCSSLLCKLLKIVFNGSYCGYHMMQRLH